MLSDPSLYLPLLIAGVFAAAFVTGAVGFADALILNAVWLHIMPPVAAIPLVVACGVIMHATPLWKLRKKLDFYRLMPFVIGGLFGVPVGIWALGQVDPGMFKTMIGGFRGDCPAWVKTPPEPAWCDNRGQVGTAADAKVQSGT